MNYKMTFYIIGQIIRIEGILMLLPLFIAIANKEADFYSYLISIILSVAAGTFLTLKKPEKTNLYAKEGLVIVGLSWVMVCLIGAIPFILSNDISGITDAIFEIVSGFTTTGSTILKDIERLSYSNLFWRSFSQWIGGMGILVFVLALLPQTEAQTMYVLRAEVPGPIVGKLVSKIRVTARILYAIYIAMTVMLLILYIIGGMPLFDSVIHSMVTAGTGGFSVKNNSVAFYNSLYIEVVTTIFMLLFGVNFNLYYALLLGHVKEIFNSEELKAFLFIVAGSTLIITINIINVFGNFGTALRYASFQVAAMISSTGFFITDYNLWPDLSRAVLLLLMFLGACAGSTGCGIKISRVIILVKSAVSEIKRIIHPRSVAVVKSENKKVESEIINGAHTYFFVYMSIIAISVVLLSIDSFDFETYFTSVVAHINNVGPGFSAVGPVGNYHDYSAFSKWVLIFDMLAGRLEIFPVLILFSPKTWRTKK